MLLLVAIAVAHQLSPADATLVDLSNVDLKNFRFFKYPHQQPNRPAAPAGPPLQIPPHLLRIRTADGSQSPPLIVVRTIVRPQSDAQQSPGTSAGPLAKLRAIFGYVGGVLFGNLPGTPDIPVRFHPDAAYRMRERFQQRYGFRGERLVESLGTGGVNRVNG